MFPSTVTQEKEPISSFDLVILKTRKILLVGWSSEMLCKELTL